MKLIRNIFISCLFSCIPFYLSGTNTLFLLLSSFGFGYELYHAKELAPLKEQFSSWIKDNEIKTEEKTIKQELNKNDSWEKTDQKEKIAKTRGLLKKRKHRIMRLGLSTIFLFLGLILPPLDLSNNSLTYHPKTQRIQFRERLNAEQMSFFTFTPQLLPYFKTFEGFVPGWDKSPDIENFLSNKNTSLQNYATLSTEEKKELFTWIYRQYWNCSKEELCRFFTTEIEKPLIKKYPPLAAAFTDFIAFLSSSALDQELVNNKAFFNCADQGKSADCGPYSLQTALFLSQNQEDQLLNKKAYAAFTEKLREDLVTAALNATEAEKNRKKDGNLDENELRRFIPHEIKDIFIIDAEQLKAYLLHNILGNPFQEAIALFNTTGKVLFLCNTGSHWLTMECTKTTEGKVNIRAFDPGSAHEESGILKNNAIGATHIATTMLYAFIQEVQKIH